MSGHPPSLLRGQELSLLGRVRSLGGRAQALLPQREYFRFYGVGYSFVKTEDRSRARGTDLVDQEGT